jgi:hypothetical protein
VVTASPSTASTSFSTVTGVPFSGSSRPLAAEQKEELQRKKAERAEKKLQRKQIRGETLADIKAKVPDATSKSTKLRLYVTILKLKLHL